AQRSTEAKRSAECPDPCAARGTPKKSNLILHLSVFCLLYLTIKRRPAYICFCSFTKVMQKL
ncbi:MAG: hypothetical protein NZ519_11685, partial [Bacteroidia bacterium]|nr:hypothetical protein [Bacteroidia bacterium]